MTTMPQSLTRAIAVACAFATMTGAALARDVVTAESRFGNGSVTAPVRDTTKGPQVRLPGGSWVYCRKSCSETLRVETVDIFENQGSMTGYGTRMNECGVFGCLEIRYPR